MMRQKAWFTFLILWVALSVRADHFKYSFFYSAGMNEGISQLSVMAMCQDTRGYLWLGTRNGLNRYNGSTYTVYSHRSGDSLSLADNEISCLAEQGGRYLWIGTSHGVSRLSLDTDSIRNYYQKDGLSSEGILTVYVDRDRQVWVGHRTGLCRYLPEEDRFQAVPFSKETLSVSAIMQDSTGKYWIGTVQQGIHLCDSNMQPLKHFCERDGSLAGHRVTALHEDAFHRIWVGTNPGGVTRIDPNSYATVRYTSKNSGLKNNYVRCMAQWNGELLMGTYDGVYSFNHFDNKITKVGGYGDWTKPLGHYSIYSFCLDRTGTLWIGTYAGGISRLSTLSSRFVHHAPGLWNNIRTGIYGTACYDRDNNLWVATEGYGLLNYDISTGETHFYLIDSSAYSVYNANVIKSVLAEEDCIWCGTTKGEIYRFDLKTRRFRLFHRFQSAMSVYSLVRDSYGNLWVGTSGGPFSLGCFTPSGQWTDEVVDASGEKLFIHSVRCLYEERPGVLLIGTRGYGLYRMEITSPEDRGKDGKITGTLSAYNKSNADTRYKLQSDYISAIMRTRGGEVWISTYGGGMYRLDNDGYIDRRVTDRDGLLSNTICNLVEGADNTLWMSTDKGIAGYSLNNGSILNYPFSNGIQVREFTLHGGVALPEGIVCLTGNDGFVTFNTSDMPVNTFVPPIVFESFQVNNRMVAVGDGSGILSSVLDNMKEVRLSYDQNNIAIGYRALNFINSSMNRYAYRLEGYDKGWNEVEGRTTAYYTKLPSGTYTFRVKASNNDGVWNEEGRTLRIIIAPPLWATWYAYMLYGILLVAIIFIVFYYYNMRRLLREELRVEQREKQQQQEFHQAKMRLFTNLAHELRTPLTLIITPFEELVKRLDLGTELHTQLLVIYKNAQRLLLLVNQIMDLQKNQSGAMELRVSEGNVCEFIREIYYAFKQIAQTNEVNFTLKCQPASFIAWYDKTLLEKVVFNLLSNAFKYTPPGKDIHMEVTRVQENGRILLRVEDSGCGIPPEEREKIFTPFYQVPETSGVNISGTGIGLSLVYSIVQLYKGSIRIEDRANGEEGTVFVVELPATEDAFTEEERDVMPMETIGETALAQPVEPKPASQLPEEVQKKPVVLIVEDDKNVRDYLRRSLESDYTILEASNGEKGYERAVLDFPDLILSDIMMPKRNGLELCAMIKEDVRVGHIPVILMTARSMVVHIKEGFQAGADDYVIKPFSMDVLRIRIHSLLQSRQQLKKLYGRRFSPEVVGTSMVSADERFSQKLYEVIEKHISDPELSIDILCQEIGISRANLYRKIKAISELSPTELIRSKRLEVAMKYLKETDMSISDIAAALGFSSHSYFSNSFKAQYGMSPSEFIQNIKLKK